MKCSLEAFEAAVACAPSLADCAASALLEPEFVANWNRIDPAHPITVVSQLKRLPIEAMVDNACNLPPVLWSEETREQFFSFVRDYLYQPTFDDVLAAAEERMQKCAVPIPPRSNGR